MKRHKLEFTSSGSLTPTHASTLVPGTMQCHQQKSLQCKGNDRRATETPGWLESQQSTNCLHPLQSCAPGRTTPPNWAGLEWQAWLSIPVGQKQLCHFVNVTIQAS